MIDQPVPTDCPRQLRISDPRQNKGPSAKTSRVMSTATCIETTEIAKSRRKLPLDTIDVVARLWMSFASHLRYFALQALNRWVQALNKLVFMFTGNTLLFTCADAVSVW